MTEDEVKKNYESAPDQFGEDKLKIPALKYFWQVSPLSSGKVNNIPKFLRALKVFEQFSDYELKVFSSFMHQRHYVNDEIVIKEGDSGFGFYLIFSGNIEIFASRTIVEDGKVESDDQFVIRLSKYEYFGELALLEQQSKRNASAISKGSSTLLCIYKPDLEEMIDRHPVIGAKFLQAIALIVAMRFNSVTNELRNSKDRIKVLQSKISGLEQKLEEKEKEKLDNEEK